MRLFVLPAAAAVGQIARRDDEIRTELCDESDERVLDLGVLACAHVEIGNVQDGCAHGRNEAIWPRRTTIWAWATRPLRSSTTSTSVCGRAGRCASSVAASR